MAYKKDPITNQIIELDFFGSEFDNWLEVSDQDLLEEAKIKKLAELEKNVINYRYKNITINGVEYIASAKAIDNLAKARRLIEDQGLTSVDWLDANNNLVTMTISLVLQINLLSFQQQSNSYLQSVVISGQINSASSLEELDQININL